MPKNYKGRTDRDGRIHVPYDTNPNDLDPNDPNYERIRRHLLNMRDLDKPENRKLKSLSYIKDKMRGNNPETGK